MCSFCSYGAGPPSGVIRSFTFIVTTLLLLLFSTKELPRNPIMMLYLRKLFWLSATFNFRLKPFIFLDAIMSWLIISRVSMIVITSWHCFRTYNVHYLIPFFRSLQQSTCPLRVTTILLVSFLGVTDFFFL